MYQCSTFGYSQDLYALLFYPNGFQYAAKLFQLEAKRGGKCEYGLCYSSISIISSLITAINLYAIHPAAYGGKGFQVANIGLIRMAEIPINIGGH